uniref:Sushi domain-containing protein n=1 Tax=Strigops habroptila TaxID=2489341 RepID=A0A672U830_STRHB
TVRSCAPVPCPSLWLRGLNKSSLASTHLHGADCTYPSLSSADKLLQRCWSSRAPIQGVKKSRYLPGESARYQCWRGFEMTGASTVVCQNGTWTELPTGIWLKPRV